MKAGKPFRATAAVVRNLTRDDETDSDFPLAYKNSKHEREIRKYFGDSRAGIKSDFKIVPSVFLCFTNRCGSSFIAEQLASTGKMPLARESFNSPRVINFNKRVGAKSFHHFCQILVESHTKNGVFASKIGWTQLYFLCRSKVIPEVFGMPRFIHVRRRDVLAQAISFVIAKQTGAWSSKHAMQSDPRYDATAIATFLESIAYGNAQFEVLLARFGFPKLEIIYEEFLNQDGAGVSTITEWLGLGRSTVDRCKARLKVQRNAENDEWKARFLDEQQRFFRSSNVLKDNVQ